VARRTRFCEFDRFGFWWGEPSAAQRQRYLNTGTYSNIEPEDYVGPKRCASCHASQYKAWSEHSHRWMNAAATPDRVVGDFSGAARFRYLGGEGRFWRDGDQFYMSAERGPVRRVFHIKRTIGSRYFQYYVGVQTAGPEQPGDPRYQEEHVLPFGYWLTKKQWVPTVHIREDRADDEDLPSHNPYEDFYFRSYDDICARCHTTLPLGDWLVRAPAEAGRYSPHRFSLDLAGYLNRQRPGLLTRPPEQFSNEELEQLLNGLVSNRPPARIVHLGIVCEACHAGGRLHVADPEQTPPHFFPTSPLLLAQLPRDDPHGRTHANVNAICGRCHVGPRPEFPGGMSTWNSAEYSDALRGSCYTQLRCIDCHEPHQSIGPAWRHSADHDDGLCLKCHDSYREAKARQAHTHHPAGSPGDRCMNCHMPRINEGLDVVVRTHTIFSPTKTVSIEKNGPNACNLCHLDKPINWTLGHLRDWYGKRYNEDELDRNYASRTEPLGHVWLRHPFRATRMVAAAAYGRQKDQESLPVLLNILDDRFLLNRQFGQLAVEEVCGRALAQWGYSFTLSPEERAAVLPKLRAALAPER
jgi:predicted CXXCH cytochrome family protein